VPDVPIVHYDIDPEIHRRAKMAAAKLGITLKEFLERALEHEAAKVEARKRR
jgi:predicted HicB family RNase H-like nuclease